MNKKPHSEDYYITIFSFRILKTHFTTLYIKSKIVYLAFIKNVTMN